MTPVPFEVYSDDGDRVFVFTPAEDGVSAASAAVYEVGGNERVPVYLVNDLSSFAYEGAAYGAAIDGVIRDNEIHAGARFEPVDHCGVS